MITIPGARLPFLESSRGAYLLALVTAILLCPASASAQCQRNAPESFVAAAHRCVGWLQHPDQEIRVPPSPSRDITTTGIQNRGERDEIGAGILVDQFLAANRATTVTSPA